MDLTRVGDGLAEMRDAADPGHAALDSHAEAGVGHGAVASDLEVPAERLLGQSVLADPGERSDLSGSLPVVKDSLAAELLRWMAEVGSAGSIDTQDLENLDPAVLQQLKALGYLD